MTVIPMRRAVALAHRALSSRARPSRREFDVVIAGGGAMGASVAYHLALADRSLRVCVVERDPNMTFSSAPRSAGGIRQQFSLKTNIELSLYGIDFLRRAADDLMVPGDEPPDLQYRGQGYLFLASAKGEATLRSNHATQREAGANTTLLSPAELSTMYPWLKLDGVALGCLGDHSEGWFDPHALVVALRAKARHMGVTLINGSVRGVETAVAPASEAARGATRTVSAVRVAADASGEEFTIDTGHLVNCAGAFANEVVAMCDEPPRRAGAEGVDMGVCVAPLPVRARRRSIFSVQAAAPSTTAGDGAAHLRPPPSASTPLVIEPGGVYFRPEGAEGHYLCGVSPPASHPDPDCAGVDELEVVDHALFEDVIWPSLYARCEAFGGLKVRSAWSGFYEYNTLDQNALLGRHPHVPNLVLCNGFSGHGLQQSPGAGRAVAELITTGRYQTVDVACFGFDRVLRGEPLFEQNIV